MYKKLRIGALGLMTLLSVQMHSMDTLSAAKAAVTAPINKLFGTTTKPEKNYYIHLTGKITPKKIIRWDLDNTIMALEKKAVIASACKNLPVFVYNLILRHPATFAELLKSGACSEEWQTTFKALNEDPNSYEHRMAQAIVEISQSKYILPGMLEFVKELNRQGFEQEVLTNMGKNDLEYVKTKHPELFSYFSHVTGVTYEKGKKAIKKPMPEYFTNLTPRQEESVFIDDSEKNCRTAVASVGFDAITVPGNNNNAAFLQKVFAQAGCPLSSDK